MDIPKNSSELTDSAFNQWKAGGTAQMNISSKIELRSMGENSSSDGFMRQS